jgi:hypothetical protein
MIYHKVAYVHILFAERTYGSPPRTSALKTEAVTPKECIRMAKNALV